jgi:mRNA interferase RelE/StbE
MSFQVILNKKIKCYLLSLPSAHQERIARLIDRLSLNPYPLRVKTIAVSSANFDIKKCKGHQTRYRARIGEYRLIYQIDNASERVLILKLDTRGNVY